MNIEQIIEEKINQMYPMKKGGNISYMNMLGTPRSDVKLIGKPKQSYKILGKP